MREIKFRAWEYGANKMLTWEQLCKCRELGELLNDDILYSPMQFTGLKDKNGIEIYESDIVEVYLWYETKTPHKSLVYFTPKGILITHHPAHLNLGHKGGRSLFDYCLKKNKKHYCKVIGNFYENPELL